MGNKFTTPLKVNPQN